ncbi:MAG TPA: hypothetical protein VJ596_00935 [Gemmatimonadaceae bacterium]|nr:hypothetical protein [Gemmatimonadaceae bacterium]
MHIPQAALLLALMQGGHDHTREPDTAATLSVNEAMSGRMVETPHMRLTAKRAASARDSTRAREIVGELQRGIERYEDYRVAQREGYQIFLPNVPQDVYHFTNYRRAIASAFKFNASEPTSLLYRKSRGGYELVGAMYTAPKNASLDQLDERVPLSVAQWHAHTNICVPRRAEHHRWRETRSGQPVFGPKGAISTRTECDAEGGRFFPQLFGWMVHVSREGEWGDDHRHNDHEH